MLVSEEQLALHQLIELYLRGEASESQQATIMAAIEQDESVLADIYQEALMDSELNSFFKKTTTEDLMRRVVKACGAAPTRSHRRRLRRPSSNNWLKLVPLASAAMLLLGISIVMLIDSFEQAPLLRVVDTNGPAVYIIDQQTLHRAGPGDFIYEGYQFTVAERSGASLEYMDGTTLVCEPDTHLEFHTVNGSKLVRIDGGHLHAEVVKQARGTSLTLRSQHAEAKVLGTKFDLRVDDAKSTLEVSEGLVQFGNKQGDLRTLSAGHGAAIDHAGLIQDFQRNESYDAPYNWREEITAKMPATWRCQVLPGETEGTYALGSVVRKRFEHHGIVSGDRWYQPPFRIHEDSRIRMRVKLKRNKFWHMFLMVQEKPGRAPSFNFELHPKMPENYQAGEWATVEVALSSGKRPREDVERVSIEAINDYFCWRYFVDSQEQDIGITIGSFEVINPSK